MKQMLPAFDKALGRWLKTQRLGLELSQEKFAQPTGVTFQQLQKWEAGSNRIPFVVLVKLAAVYRFSLDALATYLTPYAREGK